MRCHLKKIIPYKKQFRTGPALVGTLLLLFWTLEFFCKSLSTFYCPDLGQKLTLVPSVSYFISNADTINYWQLVAQLFQAYILYRGISVILILLISNTNLIGCRPVNTAMLRELQRLVFVGDPTIVVNSVRRKTGRSTKQSVLPIVSST